MESALPGNHHPRSSERTFLGPLFLLVYINDLVENVKCDIKLFVDDTSLFSVVRYEVRTASALNRDLERVSLWAWQWKMQFNIEKTEEMAPLLNSSNVNIHH